MQTRVTRMDAPICLMRARVKWTRTRVRLEGARVRGTRARIRGRRARIRGTRACIRKTRASIHGMGARERWTRARIHWMRARIRWMDARIHETRARKQPIHARIHVIRARERQTPWVQDRTSLTLWQESRTGLWIECLSLSCTGVRVWSRRKQRGSSEAKSPRGATWHECLGRGAGAGLRDPLGTGLRAGGGPIEAGVVDRGKCVDQA
jgi:hypothetical protein